MLLAIQIAYYNPIHCNAIWLCSNKSKCKNTDMMQYFRFLLLCDGQLCDDPV